jgi:hypothetical protein
LSSDRPFMNTIFLNNQWETVVLDMYKSLRTIDL